MSTRLKILVATAALCFGGALAPPADVRQAQADVDLDISFFYSSLAPHGDWIQVQGYGYGWVPDNVDFGWRPYTVGEWAWVEPYGWTWVSYEPWGWATFHYGRWIYAEDYGWTWLPGNVWAPAYVAFRYSDPWVGWAPLPPSPGWTFGAAYDVGGLNANLNLGTYAWNFVATRYFAEPDLRTHLAVTSYNPYLVQNTQWSTRYAAIEGGVANLGVDVAAVEKARKAPVTRRRLRELESPEVRPAKVESNDVPIFRPRIAPTEPKHAPAPRQRGRGPGESGAELDAWVKRREAALQAHLEAQKKAVEQEDLPGIAPQPADPAPAPAPAPGTGPGMSPGTAPGTGPGMAPPKAPAADAAARRAAAQQAFEAERKRLQDLFERQKKRREQELSQPPAPPKPDDRRSRKDEGKDDGKGGGKKDK